MSEVLRLYRYKGLLSSRRGISAGELTSILEISRATFKRDLAKLRDQMHMPIEFDRDLGGYILVQGQADNELPGLWFSQGEILALVTPDEVDSDSAAAMLLPGKNSMPVRCTNSA